MYLFRSVEGFSHPLGLGLCPLEAEFTGCDSFEGLGTCSFYGFFSEEQDPFEEGELLLETGPRQISLKCMPITFPTP